MSDAAPTPREPFSSGTIFPQSGALPAAVAPQLSATLLLEKLKVSQMAKYFALAILTLSVAACGDTWGQRAVTGGGIGAGSGAVIGAVTGFNPLAGALIGGAVGAGVGAATTPRR